jgi:hypothetical protein
MRSRVVGGVAFIFAGLHLVISIGAVLLAATTGQMFEWGMPLAACLTTFPLADIYDRLLDRAGMPLAVQIAVPIGIGP